MAELSFEEAFQALEQTVEQLETGNLPLEEALALYERGMQLAAQCNQQLDTAELRVRQITALLAGPIEESEFEDER